MSEEINKKEEKEYPFAKSDSLPPGSREFHLALSEELEELSKTENKNHYKEMAKLHRIIANQL